jgi:hypothetical protein
MFSRRHNSSDGLQSHCKSCVNNKAVVGIAESITEKECFKCKRLLGPKRFYRSKQTIDGLTPYCRECKGVADRTSKYGVSDVDVRSLVGRSCDACGQVSARTLQVDHDHNTGAVRGFLCGPCNRALGALGDDLERVRMLLVYMEGRV